MTLQRCKKTDVRIQTTFSSLGTLKNGIPMVSMAIY